jgi:TRAP-type mannitol/chloroaromatic compound transport system permease small subunit
MSQQGTSDLPHHSVVETDYLPHTKLPDTVVSRRLDAIVTWIGYSVSWLWLAIVAVILYAVISRYAFGAGSVMLEEIEWHISGLVWMLGLSYALVSDHHVRVDVLHERFSLKVQAWIELLGLGLLLLPFLIIAVDLAIPYFWSAYLQNEVSQAPAGLPARWAMKFVLPLAFSLLIVATVSRLLKCTALLFGWPRPLPPAKRPQP